MKHARLLQTCALCLMMTATAHPASAQGTLVPEQCTVGIGGRPVCYPIEDIGFSFEGPITAEEGAKGYITCNGDTVAEKEITVRNHSSQGWAIMLFDEPLILPKGQDYRVSIPAGMLALESDPTVTNDELASDFNIPASLPEAINRIEDGDTIEELSWFTFYYRVETKALATNPQATLYRKINDEWVDVRTFPVNVTYDWDLGQAWVDFGGTMHFEKGGEYKLVMKAGTISALYRDDIVNEEASITFTGGYTEPLPTINYIKTNITTYKDFDRIYELKFYYDVPVKLTPGMMIKLLRIEDEGMITGAEPTLEQDDGLWVVTADFGGFDMTPYDGFIVSMPEGLVVSAEGDVVANGQSSTQIGGTTGIGNTADKAAAVSCDGRRVTITGAAAGERITLLTADGRAVCGKTAGGADVSIELPGRGLFIVRVGTTAYKITGK